MPTPSLYENFRWHLRHTAWLYRSVAIAFTLLAIVIFMGHLATKDRGRKVEEFKSWPLVDAVVTESKLRELNTSDDTSFSTKLSLSAKFRYPFSGSTYESDYRGSWYRSDHRDWSQVFAVGQTVTIRVSPADPSNISLVDLTGTP